MPEDDDRRPPPPPRPARGYYPPAPRRGGGCLPWVVVLLLLALAGSVFFNLVLVAGRIDLGDAGGSARGGKDLQTEWVEGEGEDRVLMIDVSGVIMEESGPAGPFSSPMQQVTELRRRLDQARDDERVKAVVLRVDSPGGSVSASDQMWKEIEAFKADTGYPVVVSMGGVAASGGYYIAAPADFIFAEPTTITGSIGVIMSSINVHELMQKIGIQDVTITSGPNKDLLNPLQPLEADDRQILQTMIDDAYVRFTTIVAEGRGLDMEKVREIADGRIYTATQAKELGLVDEIGYREDAFAKARELAGVARAEVVRYTREPGLFDVLSGNAQARFSQRPLIDLSRSALLDAQTRRLYYLYR